MRYPVTRWKFYAFKSLAGNYPVEEWQGNLETESYAKFSAILDHLGVLPREFWGRPSFDVLRGTMNRGMGEIRFKENNKTHRLYGWFGPEGERGSFVLLHGCTKQRKNIEPDIRIARDRRDLVISHGRRCLYDFPLKD
jgi:hypothetical protein